MTNLSIGQSIGYYFFYAILFTPSKQNSFSVFVPFTPYYFQIHIKNSISCNTALVIPIGALTTVANGQREIPLFATDKTSKVLSA